MTRQVPTLSSPLESERFAWLDKLADPLQQGLHKLFGANKGTKEAKDWLNGTPIRHRVHPAIIIWPLGAWTMGTVLDLLDGLAADRRYRAAADASVLFGIIGTFPTAAAGLADWVDTYDHHRRVGMAHATLNGISLALYIASLALRSGGDGRRGAARALSGLGFATIGLSGALGGELVYNLGVNVPHLLYPKPPNKWTDVLASADLPEGKPIVAEVERVPVMLLRRGDEIFAVQEWCTHAGGPLSEGKIEGELVQCPWHGSCFALRDGRPINGPASAPLRTFEVREANGRIAVRPSYEGQEWPPAPAPPHARPAVTAPSSS